VKNPNTVNTGHAGKAYPIKWQLKDGNGSFVTDLAAVDDVVVVPTACDAFATDQASALEAATAGSTSLRYDSATNQYVYNWATQPRAVTRCC
jgi:hypothetical protein